MTLRSACVILSVTPRSRLCTHLRDELALEGAGHLVHDVGVEVPAEVDVAQQHRVRLQETQRLQPIRDDDTPGVRNSRVWSQQSENYRTVSCVGRTHASENATGIESRCEVTNDGGGGNTTSTLW